MSLDGIYSREDFFVLLRGITAVPVLEFGNHIIVEHNISELSEYDAFQRFLTGFPSTATWAFGAVVAAIGEVFGVVGSRRKIYGEKTFVDYKCETCRLVADRTSKRGVIFDKE